MSHPRPRLLRRMASVALVALLAGGCAFDIDETPNSFPDPPVPDVTPPMPDASEGDGDVGAMPVETCDCLQVGDWYRFTSLAPTALADQPRHPLVLTLQNLWARDIERYELNVLFQVTAIDGDRITVQALNAARGELGSGEICMLPETLEELYFVRDADDPCTVRMERPQQINIYAGTPEIPRNCAPTLEKRHAIPVTNIQLVAKMSPDCSELLDGRAEGAGIPEPALPLICTCPGISGPAENCDPIDAEFENGSCDGCNPNFQNLYDLMVTLSRGMPLPAECPDADGVPGVCIDAAFTAERWLGETPECGAPRASFP